MKRILSFIFSLTYFFGNVVLSHALETNIWAERRSVIANREAVKQPHPSIGLPRSANNASLAMTLPFFSAFGSFTDVTIPAGAKTTVIHVQDIHGNIEAQENISRAIQEWIQQRNVSVLALEGLFAPMDVAAARKAGSLESRQAAADYLLAEDVITGPLHLALTQDVDLKVIGVDDRLHHALNVEAYRNSHAQEPALRRQLVEEKKELHQKKQTAFNSALLNFDQKMEEYRGGRLSLGALLSSSSLSGAWPQIDSFKEAYAMESGFDFSRIESERSRLLSELVAKLSAVDHQQLVDRTALFRSGHINQAEFYGALTDLCQRKDVPLDRFPLMNDYLRYVLLTEKINGQKLLAEVKEWETRQYAALTHSPEEKELIAQARALYLKEKLASFELTREEWNEYKNVPSASYLVPSNSHQPFEKFYREAEIRDEKIATNLLGAKHQALGTVVLVTGGFHNEGIKKQLLAAGVGVASFVPRMSKMEGASSYLSVFQREKTPLEKLFAGNRLFLSRPYWTEPDQTTYLAAVSGYDVLTGGFDHVQVKGPRGSLIKAKRISSARAAISIVFQSGAQKVRAVLQKSSNKYGFSLTFSEPELMAMGWLALFWSAAVLSTGRPWAVHLVLGLWTGLFFFAPKVKSHPPLLLFATGPVNLDASKPSTPTYRPVSLKPYTPTDDFLVLLEDKEVSLDHKVEAAFRIFHRLWFLRGQEVPAKVFERLAAILKEVPFSDDVRLAITRLFYLFQLFLSDKAASTLDDIVKSGWGRPLYAYRLLRDIVFTRKTRVEEEKKRNEAKAAVDSGKQEAEKNYKAKASKEKASSGNPKPKKVRINQEGRNAKAPVIAGTIRPLEDVIAVIAGGDSSLEGDRSRAMRDLILRKNQAAPHVGELIRYFSQGKIPDDVQMGFMDIVDSYSESLRPDDLLNLTKVFDLSGMVGPRVISRIVPVFELHQASLSPLMLERMAAMLRKRSPVSIPQQMAIVRILDGRIESLSEAVKAGIREAAHEDRTRGKVKAALDGLIERFDSPLRQVMTVTGLWGGVAVYGGLAPLVEESVRLLTIAGFGWQGALAFCVLHAFAHFYIDIFSKDGDQLRGRKYLRRVGARFLYSAAFTLPYASYFADPYLPSSINFVGTTIELTQQSLIGAGYALAFLLHHWNNTWVYDLLVKRWGWKWLRMSVAPANETSQSEVKAAYLPGNIPLEEILKALKLDDLNQLAEGLGEKPEVSNERYTVWRLDVEKLIEKLPELALLQTELAPVDQFDLVLNHEGEMIGIVPVMNGIKYSNGRPHYLALWDYKLLPQVDDPDFNTKWDEVKSKQDRDQYLVKEYYRKGNPPFPKPLPPTDSEQPSTFVFGDLPNGDGDTFPYFYGFPLNEIKKRIEDRKNSRKGRQHLFAAVPPGVYSPAIASEQGSDADYWKAVWRFRQVVEKVTWGKWRAHKQMEFMVLGGGVDVWILHNALLQAKNEGVIPEDADWTIHVRDPNPLACAFVRTLARTHNIPNVKVEVASGIPEGKKYDMIFWNTDGEGKDWIQVLDALPRALKNKDSLLIAWNVPGKITDKAIEEKALLKFIKNPLTEGQGEKGAIIYAVGIDEFKPVIMSVTGKWGGPAMVEFVMPLLEELARAALSYYTDNNLTAVIFLSALIHAYLHLYIDWREGGIDLFRRRFLDRLVISAWFGMFFIWGTGFGEYLEINPQLMGFMFSSAAHIFFNYFIVRYFEKRGEIDLPPMVLLDDTIIPAMFKGRQAKAIVKAISQWAEENGVKPTLRVISVRFNTESIRGLPGIGPESVRLIQEALALVGKSLAEPLRFFYSSGRRKPPPEIEKKLPNSEMALLKLIYKELMIINISIFEAVSKFKHAGRDDDQDAKDAAADFYDQIQQRLYQLQENVLIEAAQVKDPLHRPRYFALREKLLERVTQAIGLLENTEEHKPQGVNANVVLMSAIHLVGEEYKELLEDKVERLQANRTVRPKFGRVYSKKKKKFRWRLQLGRYRTFHVGKQGISTRQYSDSYFDSLWEAFRAVDHIIDNELTYRDRVQEARALIKTFLEELAKYKKDKTPQGELDPGMVEKLVSLARGLKAVHIVEIELASLAAEVASHLYEVGDTGPAYSLLVQADNLLERREREIMAIISHTRNTRITPMRRYLGNRNKDIGFTLKRIRAYLESPAQEYAVQNFKEAAKTSLARLKGTEEPDLLALRALLSEADSLLRFLGARRKYLPPAKFRAMQRERQKAKDRLEKIAQLLDMQLKASEGIHKFMKSYRYYFVDMRLKGEKDEAKAQKDAFYRAFHGHIYHASVPVKNARDGKTHPDFIRWWHRFYQAAFIPMNLDEGKERVPNPDFKAWSFLSVLMYEEDLYPIVNSSLKKHAPKTLEYLDSVKDAVSLFVLTEDEWRTLLDKVAEDFPGFDSAFLLHAIEEREAFIASLQSPRTQSWWIGGPGFESLHETKLPYLEEAIRLIAIMNCGFEGVIIYAGIHAFLHFFLDIYAARGDGISWHEFLTDRFWFRFRLSIVFSLPYLLTLLPLPISSDVLWAAAFFISVLIHDLNNNVLKRYFDKHNIPWLVMSWWKGEMTRRAAGLLLGTLSSTLLGIRIPRGGRLAAQAVTNNSAVGTVMETFVHTPDAIEIAASDSVWGGLPEGLGYEELVHYSDQSPFLRHLPEAIRPAFQRFNRLWSDWWEFTRQPHSRADINSYAERITQRAQEFTHSLTPRERQLLDQWRASREKFFKPEDQYDLSRPRGSRSNRVPFWKQTLMDDPFSIITPFDSAADLSRHEQMMAGFPQTKEFSSRTARRRFLGGGTVASDWSWRLPTNTEIDEANQMKDYLSEMHKKYPQRGLGDLYLDHPVYRKTIWKRRVPARVLRTLYFLDPELAAQILLGFGDGGHFFFTRVIQAQEVDRTYTLEKTLFESLVRDSMQLLIQSKKDLEGKPVDFSLNWVGLGWIAREIYKVRKEEFFLAFNKEEARQFAKGIEEALRIRETFADDLKAPVIAAREVLLRHVTALELSELAATQPPLTPADEASADEMIRTIFSTDPSDWRILGNVFGNLFGHPHYFPYLTGRPYQGRQDQAAALRLIYRSTPIFAGILLGTFGDARDWVEILEAKEEDGSWVLNAEFCAALFDSAFMRYRENPSGFHPEEGMAINWDVPRIAELFSQLSPERQESILNAIHEDQRYLIVESAVAHLFEYPDAFKAILDLFPDGALEPSKSRFSQEVREVLMHHGKLARPLTQDPVYTTEPIARNDGVGVGQLYVFEKSPDIPQLELIPPGAIVAMPTLQTSEMFNPWSGILTFVDTGEGCHAEAVARARKIPHGVVPGPDWITESGQPLSALNGQIVRLEVKDEEVKIRLATPDEIRKMKIRPPSEMLTPVTLAQAKTGGSDVILIPGDPGLKDTERFGYKVSATRAVELPESMAEDVELGFSLDWGIPFEAFYHILKEADEDEDVDGDESSVIERIYRLTDLYEEYMDRIQHINQVCEMSDLSVWEKLDKTRKYRARLIEIIHSLYLPGEFWEKLETSGGREILFSQGFFLRGASTAEGNPQNPEFGVGLNLTIENVRSEEALEEGVREIWASIWSDAAMMARIRRGVNHFDIHQSIWLVPSQRAVYSGVLHTRNISTKQPDKGLIMLVQGLGRAMVDPKEKLQGAPTRVEFDLATGLPVFKRASQKEYKLVLAEGGGTIEEPTRPEDEFLLQPEYGKIIRILQQLAVHVNKSHLPQEMEYAIVRTGPRRWKITILQSRDLKAGSDREDSEEFFRPLVELGIAQPQELPDFIEKSRQAKTGYHTKFFSAAQNQRVREVLQQIIPEKDKNGDKSIQFRHLGIATGQEVYGAAVLIYDELKKYHQSLHLEPNFEEWLADWDIRLDAFDRAYAYLEAAKEGRFTWPSDKEEFIRGGFTEEEWDAYFPEGQALPILRDWIQPYYSDLQDPAMDPIYKGGYDATFLLGTIEFIQPLGRVKEILTAMADNSRRPHMLFLDRFGLNTSLRIKWNESGIELPIENQMALETSRRALKRHESYSPVNQYAHLMLVSLLGLPEDRLLLERIAGESRFPEIRELAKWGLDNMRNQSTPNSHWYYKAKLNGKSEEEAVRAGWRGMMLEGIVLIAVPVLMIPLDAWAGPFVSAVIIHRLAYHHAELRELLIEKQEGRAPPASFRPKAALYHAALFLPYLLFAFTVPFLNSEPGTIYIGAIIAISAFYWHAFWDAKEMKQDLTRYLIGAILYVPIFILFPILKNIDAFLEWVDRWTQTWEFLSYVVTVLGLPLLLITMVIEHLRERKEEAKERVDEEAERLNEEKTIDGQLRERYDDILDIPIQHPELGLLTGGRKSKKAFTPRENEIIKAYYLKLIGLFEDAYLFIYEEKMEPNQLARWSSWEQDMRELLRTKQFRADMEKHLQGNDPDFVSFFKKLAEDEDKKSSTPALIIPSVWNWLIKRLHDKEVSDPKIAGIVGFVEELAVSLIVILGTVGLEYFSIPSEKSLLISSALVWLGFSAAHFFSDLHYLKDDKLFSKRPSFDEKMMLAFHALTIRFAFIVGLFVFKDLWQPSLFMAAYHGFVLNMGILGSGKFPLLMLPGSQIKSDLQIAYDEVQGFIRAHNEYRKIQYEELPPLNELKNLGITDVKGLYRFAAGRFVEAVEPYIQQMPVSREDLKKIEFGQDPVSPLFSKLVKNKLVVDLGTGVGHSAFLTAASGASRVIGLDRSYESVQLAQQNAELMGGIQDRVEFIQADMMELPFADGSIDVSTSRHTLTSFSAEMRKIALQEIFRVLQPGGIYIGIERVNAPDVWTLEELSRILIETGFKVKFIETNVKDSAQLIAEKPFEIKPSPGGMPTIADMLTVLEKEGVEVIITQPGELAYGLLFKASVQPPYLEAILSGETSQKSWPENQALAITSSESNLAAIAKQCGISLQEFRLRLGMSPASKLLIVLDHRHATQQILFEETIHALEGKSLPQHLIPFSMDEIVNDLIQLLFYDRQNLDAFYSPHSNWTLEEKQLIYDRYVTIPGLDPNTQLAEILIEIRTQVRNMPDTLPLLLSQRLDRIKRAYPRAEVDWNILLKSMDRNFDDYLGWLLENHHFGKYSPLFPNWKLKKPPQESPSINSQVSWRGIFGNNNPISVEIGVGRGEVMALQAKIHPSRNFVGIELGEKTAEIPGNLQKENISIVNGEADEFIDQMFQEGEIAEVTYQFPYPDHVSELSNGDWLELFMIIQTKLRPGGRFLIATENPDLAARIQDLLSMAFHNNVELAVIDPDVYEEGDGDRKTEIPLDRSPYFKAAMEDNQRVFILSAYNPTELGSSKVSELFAVDKAALSKDGTRVTASNASEIRTWFVPSRTLRKKIEIPDDMRVLDIQDVGDEVITVFLNGKSKIIVKDSMSGFIFAEMNILADVVSAQLVPSESPYFGLLAVATKNGIKILTFPTSAAWQVGVELPVEGLEDWRGMNFGNRGEISFTPEMGELTSFVVSFDGDYIAANHGLSTFIWHLPDHREGQLKGTIHHAQPLTALKMFNDRPHTLLILVSGNQAEVWNFTFPMRISTLAHRETITSAALMPNLYFAATAAGSKVYFRYLISGNISQMWDLGQPVIDLSFSGDLSSLACTLENGEIHVINLTGEKPDEARWNRFRASPLPETIRSQIGTEPHWWLRMFGGEEVIRWGMRKGMNHGDSILWAGGQKPRPQPTGIHWGHDFAIEELEDRSRRPIPAGTPAAAMFEGSIVGKFLDSMRSTLLVSTNLRDENDRILVMPYTHIEPVVNEETDQVWAIGDAVRQGEILGTIERSKTESSLFPPHLHLGAFLIAASEIHRLADPNMSYEVLDQMVVDGVIEIIDPLDMFDPADLARFFDLSYEGFNTAIVVDLNTDNKVWPLQQLISYAFPGIGVPAAKTLEKVEEIIIQSNLDQTVLVAANDETFIILEDRYGEEFPILNHIGDDSIIDELELAGELRHLYLQPVDGLPTYGDGTYNDLVWMVRHPEAFIKHVPAIKDRWDILAHLAQRAPRSVPLFTLYSDAMVQEFRSMSVYNLEDLFSFLRKNEKKLMNLSSYEMSQLLAPLMRVAPYLIPMSLLTPLAEKQRDILDRTLPTEFLNVGDLVYALIVAWDLKKKMSAIKVELMERVLLHISPWLALGMPLDPQSQSHVEAVVRGYEEGTGIAAPSRLVGFLMEMKALNRQFFTPVLAGLAIFLASHGLTSAAPVQPALSAAVSSESVDPLVGTQMSLGITEFTFEQAVRGEQYDPLSSSLPRHPAHLVVTPASETREAALNELLAVKRSIEQLPAENQPVLRVLLTASQESWKEGLVGVLGSSTQVVGESETSDFEDFHLTWIAPAKRGGITFVVPAHAKLSLETIGYLKTLGEDESLKDWVRVMMGGFIAPITSINDLLELSRKNRTNA